MDKNLYTAFKKLTDTIVPATLHNATYRAVIFLRYKRYIKIAIILTAGTFLFSLWHVYTKLIEVDAVSIFKSIVSTFELSIDSIFDSFETAFEFLPIQAIILSMLNLIALVCALFVAQTFTQFQRQSEVEIK
jgi:hypothetical protein